jgi:uncharacterized membrane protein
VTLPSLIESGIFVFIILAAMAVEAVLLRRHILRNPSILAGLAAGGCLMLALRAALIDAGTLQVTIWLGASLLCHGLELLFWLRHKSESETRLR